MMSGGVRPSTLDKKSPENAPDNLSLDAVAEDLFGLNVRGLRSVSALWVRPKDYFSAAKTTDWMGKFTPSIRLWLSFFAIYSAVKLWWIRGNDGLIQAFTEGFARAGLVLPDGVTYQDVATDTVVWIFSVIPVLQIIAMIGLSLIFPFWGEKTTIALRQRYLFGVIVPSASLMPVFMTVMLFIPSGYLSAYGVALALVTFSVDFLTGYRGAFSNKSRWQKAWRAGLLAAIVVGLNVATSIGAQIAGIVLTSQKYAALAAG